MVFSFLYCFFPLIRFVFWLCFFHLAVAHFASSLMQPLCHDHERSALLQFKQSLNISEITCYLNPYKYPKVRSWKLEGENSTADCCSWDGIKCNEDTGHVIRLDLSSSCLSGSINSSSTLFDLVHLEWLSLADNNFNYSEIPATIMNLSWLSHLNLSDSRFVGQIPPELLELSNFVSLDLSNNYGFTVPGNEESYLKLQVPSLQNLVEKLTNLKVLDLGMVYISSPVPPILANLKSLTYLSLENCQLQGEFPTKIFQLPNLLVLNLRSNSDLTGYLSGFESSPLTFLDIGGCNFSGAVPSSLGNLTKLIHLDISSNNFLGELPVSIGNLGSLKELVLEGCNFSGQISSALDNLTQLTYLALFNSYNKFSCQNPSSLSWIAKHTKLMILDISILNLVGEIPFWLTNLTQLTYLDMGHNQLTGPIPSWLMSINQLSFLSLQSNQLTRHIPSEIRNLTQLETLYLASNSLEGPIPSTIFELKNLVYLNLGFNNLSGTVELDMFVSQLESLETLVLSSNKLSVLSNTIANANFHKLSKLKLRSCNLTEFPNFLHDQDQLLALDLSSNRMSGQIPSQFLNATDYSLAYLNLSHNFLIGFDKYPAVLPSRLVTLDLRSNKLEGLLPVPHEDIADYLVSDNKLIGEISPLICNLNHLYALDVSNNNLGGVLPQCLGNFSYDLSILALHSNRFHGGIPQTFMSGTNLRMIDLSHNKLGGRIPRSLVNCTNLEFLHLGNNQISDIFPSWLGTLPELKVLVLKSNRFHGVIREPETNFEFPKLHIIDLSDNMFRGKLPSKYFQHWDGMKVLNQSQLIYLHDELKSFLGTPHFDFLGYDYSLTISNKGTDLKYGKLSNMLTGIIFSENKFVGEIPASIATLRGLRNLNLSHNNLEGCIPSSLGNLTVLESLDLSNNSLSGQIPQQLVEITSLEVFDVSHNHLTGPVPHGKQFDTFENSSYDGNPGLCGKPLSKECENFEPPKKEDEDSAESPFVFDWKPGLIGFSSGLIVGVVLGQEFYIRKHEWFVKTFGIQIMKRKRGRRN